MNRKRIKDPRRGQALAEMGMVVLLFTILCCGIVDFGRMLMILNVITHAARDGARSAALVPDGSWGANIGSIQTRVSDQIATVTPTTFTVSVSCAPAVAGGAPIANVSVEVSGAVDWLFGFPGVWGGSISVDRTATFRYENGSTCPT